MSRIVLTVCAVLIGSLFALAQDKERIVAPADEKFGPFPNFPSCMTGAVLHGDPSSSSGVTLIGKGTAGCKIPWHFHTPNEEVGIISGTAKVQMKNEAAKTLTAGAMLTCLQNIHTNSRASPLASCLLGQTACSTFTMLTRAAMRFPQTKH